MLAFKNMKLLAVDSSAVTASAAILEDGKLIALNTLNVARTHSENLLPMVEAMLRGAGLSVSDIDVFACTAGPGSFTGVRIGVSLIKGLAFVEKKPCVAVSTLRALAYNMSALARVNSRSIICPVMDARRSQLYNALFLAENGSITRLCPDRLIAAAELENELCEYDCDIFLVGDGIDAALKGFAGKRTIKTAPELLHWQNSFSAAEVAAEDYKNNISIYTAEQLSPIYLRASQAERERKDRS